jgi:DNA-binding beta-propeller fold protein YncE
MRFAGLFVGLSLALAPVSAWAELAVAANDGKQLLPGDTQTPDSVSILQLGHYPPKVIGNIQMPGSMIGSPNAIVVSKGEKFAIVTAAQKFNPADPAHPTPDDKVQVVDLADPTHPKLVQTVSAGGLAGGVSMNKRQNLVLVAAKAADAIFVFTLSGMKLTPAGRVDLDTKSMPTDVVFTQDGRKAYAVAQGAGKIYELNVEGSNVTRSGNDFATGRFSYGAVITRDGNWLLNTNLGGALEGEDRTGTIGVTDLKTHKLAASVVVGKIPEHLTLTADGKYLAVVLANGAVNSKSDPNYDKVLGLLKIYAVSPGKLDEVAQADTCHWAQGAAWSDDGRTVLQQCAAERQIQVFRFDGHSLVQDKAAAISFESRPGSVSTQKTR